MFKLDIAKLLSFFILLKCVSSQFQQCEMSQTIRSLGQSVELKHLGLNKSPSCRFSIFAPVNSFIEASCNFTLSGRDCGVQRFLVSRSGDLQLRDATAFCGIGTTLQRSIGNEIIVALTSNSALPAASFRCMLTAVALTNSNCDCGWNVRSRIVGGTQAGVNEFVSHAGLVDKNTKEVFCGAIILTQNWALTAAHCFVAFPNAATTAIITGDHDLSTGSDTIWAAAYRIQRYIKHATFNPETNVNDIALARTVEYIKFNRGTGPTCLPYTFLQNDRYFDGSFLTVVGWGVTEFAGPPSLVLKKAQIQVVDTKTCSKENRFVDNTKVCTKESLKGSSCSKDSGSGLYWYKNRYYAIGIVSYGTYCGSSIPSVNTRISSYIGWIENNVREFMCRKT